MTQINTSLSLVNSCIQSAIYRSICSSTTITILLKLFHCYCHNKVMLILNVLPCCRVLRELCSLACQLWAGHRAASMPSVTLAKELDRAGTTGRRSERERERTEGKTCTVALSAAVCPTAPPATASSWEPRRSSRAPSSRLMFQLSRGWLFEMTNKNSSPGQRSQQAMVPCHLQGSSEVQAW